MSDTRKFETMLWVDADDMVRDYVFKLLEESPQPLEYRSGSCKIRVTKNGREACSRRSTSPDWFAGIAWAMEVLEFTCGKTLWKSAISSEDDVFLVTVERIGRR